MKKIIAVIMLLSLCVLAGCGKKTNSTDSSISALELKQAMLEADSSLPDMGLIDSSMTDADVLFTNFSDCDYNLVDSYFLYYSSEGKADEIAVVKVKKEASADTLLDSLKKHAESRVRLYETYNPEETERARSSQVFKSGSYVVLIISDNSGLVKKAFENGIK